MANTTLYVRDPKTGTLLPLKAFDNGDGTYSLEMAGGAGSAQQATLLLVKAKTDLIPADIATQLDTTIPEVGADVDEIITTLGSPAGASVSADIAEIEAETDDIAAVKAKTDLIPAAIAAELAHLDVDVSTRLGSGAYTAPDNADIALIKAKTDNLPAAPAAQANLDVAVSSRAPGTTALTNATWTDARAALLDYLDSLNKGLVSAIAQAQGGGASTITLQAGSSAVADFYKGMVVVLYSGTGSGQARAITAYDGGTKIATVSPSWATAPNGTSWYVLATWGSAACSNPTAISTLILSDATPFPGADIALIKAQTDLIPADITTQLDTTLPEVGADVDEIITTLGSPVGASLSADIAEIEGETDDIAAVKTQTDKLPNVHTEVEWSTTPVVEQVSSADATNLTAGSTTPTFPTGATRVRAILFASIKAANQSAHTHHVALKVQGQKNGGGYANKIDLTAQPTLGLVNVDGAGDSWGGAVDVTTLVDTSAVQYDFRFVVDSDDADAVNYTTCFVLALVFHV